MDGQMSNRYNVAKTTKYIDFRFGEGGGGFMDETDYITMAMAKHASIRNHQ